MKFAIISPSELPIPATKGGAVETGIQQIIDKNENFKQAEIHIFSYYDTEAETISKKYHYSKFWYYKPKKINKLMTYIIKGINMIYRKIDLKKQYNTRIAYIRYVKKIIAKENYDAILIKNNEKYVLPIHKCTNSKIFLQLHNDILNKDIYNSTKIANSCYKIISNSNYIKTRVKTIVNIDDEKLLINLNCLELDRYENIDNSTLKLIKKQNNINDNDKIILYSGRMVPQKGIKELLLALKKVKSNNWKLCIIGSKWFGKNYKDKFINEIRNIINTFEDGKIMFIGFVPYKEIPIWNKIAYLSVTPSIWEEPAGRVILEAQAAGTPVITTDAGGISEYLGKEAGIIVKRSQDFIDALSKNIDNLLNNENLANSMGKKGKKAVVNFSDTKYYKEIIEILKG